MHALQRVQQEVIALVMPFDLFDMEMRMSCSLVERNLASIQYRYADFHAPVPLRRKLSVEKHWFASSPLVIMSSFKTHRI